MLRETFTPIVYFWPKIPLDWNLELEEIFLIFQLLPGDQGIGSPIVQKHDFLEMLKILKEEVDLLDEAKIPEILNSLRSETDLKTNFFHSEYRNLNLFLVTLSLMGGTMMGFDEGSFFHKLGKLGAPIPYLKKFKNHSLFGPVNWILLGLFFPVSQFRKFKDMGSQFWIEELVLPFFPNKNRLMNSHSMIPLVDYLTENGFFLIRGGGQNLDYSQSDPFKFWNPQGHKM